MSKIHHHSDRASRKQPTMTPKERKRARQIKKRQAHEGLPLLIPH